MYISLNITLLLFLNKKKLIQVYVILCISWYHYNLLARANKILQAEYSAEFWVVPSSGTFMNLSLCFYLHEQIFS